MIEILRIRCEECLTTHAIIPSFSLPGTSLDTEEAEKYLINRSEGAGRGSGGKVFSRFEPTERFLSRLDRMFQICVDRAKSFFPQAAEVTLNGMDWVASVVDDPLRPLYSLNCYCLQHGINAICFTRLSILIFHTPKTGMYLSHNMGLQRKEIIGIDSG